MKSPLRFSLSALFLILVTSAPWSLAQVAPAKTWFSPAQPLTFTNLGEADVELVVTDFLGRRIEGEGSAVVRPQESADLKRLYPAINVGTYLLYPVEPGDATVNFRSTPYVINVRGDDRPGAPVEPMVVKVEPLRYAVIETDKGSMTAAFYYDVAPNTVHNFMSLAEGGFFDGLTFHRIVPGFVIQGGDPKNDTEGGPGYQIDAEFNDRPHLPGVLSMAREGDPIERQGAMPRPEAANSAGSQFFIALDYKNTKRLDGRYTVFGRVIEGMDVLAEIGGVEIANPATGQPRQLQMIHRVRVENVTAENYPYLKLFDIGEGLEAEQTTSPSTWPSTRPATSAAPTTRSATNEQR